MHFGKYQKISQWDLIGRTNYIDYTVIIDILIIKLFYSINLSSQKNIESILLQSLFMFITYHTH
jgi:hypothetical protein